MLANGSAQKRMTSNSRTDIEPAFSPTGALIAFSSDRAGGSGGFELYVMAGLTGNAQLRITSSPGADGQPHFVAPLSLVFASARTAGAGAGLYSMSPSAVPPVKLAGTSPGDQQPG
jgi:Tol biopolymer transport system component